MSDHTVQHRRCSVNGCKSVVKVKGFCEKHYRRYLKYGDTSIVNKRCLSFADRAKIKNALLGKMQITSSFCWEWKGASANGYGKILIDQKSLLTHRVSAALWRNFDIDRGLSVCHKCDNPICINPDHLFFGTQADNMRDKKNKGRCIYGKKCHTAKLTEQDVKTIRNLYNHKRHSYTEFGRMYNVNSETISDIINGKTWNRVH